MDSIVDNHSFPLPQLPHLQRTSSFEHRLARIGKLERHDANSNDLCVPVLKKPRLAELEKLPKLPVRAIAGQGTDWPWTACAEEEPTLMVSRFLRDVLTDVDGNYTGCRRQSAGSHVHSSGLTRASTKGPRRPFDNRRLSIQRLLDIAAQIEQSTDRVCSTPTQRAISCNIRIICYTIMTNLRSMHDDTKLQPDYNVIASLFVDLGRIAELMLLSSAEEVLCAVQAILQKRHQEQSRTLSLLTLLHVHICEPWLLHILSHLVLAQSDPEDEMTTGKSDDHIHDILQGKAIVDCPNSDFLHTILPPALLDLVRVIHTSLGYLRSAVPNHPLSEISHDANLLLRSMLSPSADYKQLASRYYQTMVDAMHQFESDQSSIIEGETAVTHTAQYEDEQAVWQQNKTQQTYLRKLDQRTKEAPAFNRGTLEKATRSWLDEICQTHKTNEPRERLRVPLETPLTSLIPLLKVHARLVTISVLRITFRESGLRQHLSALRGSYMFGNGIFSQSFSHALFVDQDDEVLRLGANQKLSIASLSQDRREALHDTIRNAFACSTDRCTSGHDEVPGRLGFAGFEPSAADTHELVKDNLMHVCEVVKLYYSAPKSIAVIISEKALKLYDDIFRFLVRLQHVMFCCTRLTRLMRVRYDKSDVRQQTVCHFTMICAHFIQTLGTYCQLSLQETWTSFSRELDAIEVTIDVNLQDDSPLDNDDAITLGTIADLHLQMLTTACEQLFISNDSAQLSSPGGRIRQCFAIILQAYAFCQAHANEDTSTVAEAAHVDDCTMLGQLDRDLSNAVGALVSALDAAQTRNGTAERRPTDTVGNDSLHYNDHTRQGRYGDGEDDNENDDDCEDDDEKEDQGETTRMGHAGLLAALLRNY